MQLARDPKALKQRLLRACSLLKPVYAQAFKVHTFAFEAKRLVSGDGRMVLQWSLRPYPGRAESPDNQQTSEGCVTLINTYAMGSRK